MLETNTNADIAEIRRTLAWLCEPGAVYEVRCPKTRKGTISGYFDNLKAMVTTIASLSGTVPAVYITLNPVNPDLLNRSVNHLTHYAENTTSDIDIVSRRWLLCDLDPKRPAGISSTSQEKQYARLKMLEIRDWLKESGFNPDSLVAADSGNGYHILIRTDLPNTPESTKLCERVLKALELKFGDECVLIDRTTFNAARISKVYGTLAKKGDDITGRPHRLSTTLEVPDKIAPATTEQLRAIANLFPDKPAPKYTKNGSTINVQDWLSAHSISIRRIKETTEYTLYELTRCPWNAEHDHGEAYVMQFRDGGVMARCHHNSCQGKGWRDFHVFDATSEGGADGCPDQIKTSPQLELSVEELLDKIGGLIRRFVVLTPEQVDATILWVAHTWAFDVADATPYLSITSSEKRSGKTRLLETLELLVNRPWFTGRVTPAVLIRKIDKEGPTLLLDETDSAFKGDKEYTEALRGILNTGHRRGGKASVCIGQGANIGFKDLSTFCPKAIAGIGKLPDTVTDRSIQIVLKRRTSSEPIERFRRKRVELEAQPLRDHLGMIVSSLKLRDTEPELPQELDDRAADGWEPLLVIADAVGGSWPARARAAAIKLSCGTGREDQSLGIRLLADIKSIFDERNIDRIPSAELVKALNANEESPWSDMTPRQLDTTKLARLLKPYDIRPKTIRIDETTLKGYEINQFVDAWHRYVPPLSGVSPVTPVTSGTMQAEQSAVTFEQNPQNVTAFAQAQDRHNVTDVTAESQRQGRGKESSAWPEDEWKL